MPGRPGGRCAAPAVVADWDREICRTRTSGGCRTDASSTTRGEPSPRKPLASAPRLAALDGIRLGVLDNTKWNASKLLRQVVACLQADLTFAAVHAYAKSSFSRPAPAELLDRIAAENDAVVTAIGD